MASPYDTDTPSEKTASDPTLNPSVSHVDGKTGAAADLYDPSRFSHIDEGKVLRKVSCPRRARDLSRVINALNRWTFFSSRCWHCCTFFPFLIVCQVAGPDQLSRC